MYKAGSTSILTLHLYCKSLTRATLPFNRYLLKTAEHSVVNPHSLRAFSSPNKKNNDADEVVSDKHERDIEKKKRAKKVKAEEVKIVTGDQ